ncbi:MAG: HlyD family efflux transporter periplasmic adaptor subunit [Woeseiaceae bacterium]|nr:HlyD family efflux transporter periplasmic adaptor subunit [Woeseiaceae bacterium]
MPERATVDRLDIKRQEQGIRDTSAQDVVIERSKSRRFLPYVIGSVVAIAVLAFTVPGLTQWLGTDRSANRSQLRFSTVIRDTFVRDIAAQGVVVAAVSPTLYATTGGTVTLHVNAGDAVTTGDLVATIDSPGLDNELDRERATLDSLETNLQRQSIENKKLLLKGQQTVDLARVELVAAERELRRAEQSWGHQVISLQDYEKAQDDVERTRIELQHAESEFALNEESLDFELQTLRLERDRQRLAVGNLERRVQELELRAPVDGIVGTLAVDRRGVVPANAEIATVVDLSALEIELSVSDSYADDLVVGSDVGIKFGGEDHAATLVSVSPEVINSTVSGRVRFDGQHPAGLRQNQRVSARIVLESKEDTLVVDSGPFFDTGGGRLIYRVNGDVAERIDIVTGSRSVSQVEILQGVDVGDVVIISEIDRFRGAERVLLRD